MHWPLLLLALAGCNESIGFKGDSDPPRTAPTPPAIQRRTVENAGRQDLTPFGVRAAITLPAGAKLLWLDGTPDPYERNKHKTATVRVMHDVPDDEIIHRESGLRVFLRAALPGEPTDLDGLERHLADQRDAMQRDADDVLDKPTALRVQFGTKQRTEHGWEATWTFEKGGASTVKVWRADLGVFCSDTGTYGEATRRVLETCRTLTRP
jgi:hypothetical protein